MSSMKKITGQRGEMDVLLVPVILLTLLFIGAAIFAVWAYQGRQDYKLHSDEKSAAAVAANKEVVQAADAKQFAEAAKQPLKPYVGPEAYGSLHIMYPKTWSSYVDISDSSSLPVDLYFHNDYVPAVDMKQTYNLRVRVVATPYSSVAGDYASLIKQGKVTSVPYSLPKVPDVAGIKLDGVAIPSSNQLTGETILLPMRDKTLEIWTESTAFLPDFSGNILANMTFSP
jgi:hypothetical protein